ncbi:MAG: substrate-binding domain-containing protein, partial [Lachnospiraceae bacterium]|nr:substrate-binding domain-containing protein [Lachnospiraceae bacterium]
IYRQGSLRYGTVEIGVTETALHLFLIKKLRGFKTKYPAMRIRIHNHSTPEILKQLISGRLDFAVITMPFELPKTVISEKVLDFEEILVGGTQYKELCREPLELEEIKKYPWIGLGIGSATHELYRNFFIEHKIDIEPDMEVATSDLMLPLIESNLGIGFVAEQLAQPLLAEKKLVRIPINCMLPRRSIQLVTDKERGKSLAADTFYKYLKDGVL